LDNVAKYGSARRTTGYSIIRRRKDVIWMPEYHNATVQTRARALALIRFNAYC